MTTSTLPDISRDTETKISALRAPTTNCAPTSMDPGEMVETLTAPPTNQAHHNSTPIISEPEDFAALIRAALTGAEADRVLISDLIGHLSGYQRTTFTNLVTDALVENAKLAKSTEDSLKIAELLSQFSPIEIARLEERLNQDGNLPRGKIKSLLTAINQERKARIKKSAGSSAQENISKYINDDSGLRFEFEVKEQDEYSGKIIEKTRVHWIGSRLDILGMCRTAHGDNWGYLLGFSDPDGTMKTVIVSMATLNDNNELFKTLNNLGYSSQADKENSYHLPKYIRSQASEKRIKLIDQAGWVGDIYVLGDKNNTVINQNQSTGEIYQLHPKPTSNLKSQAGDLESWRNDIAKLCEGNNFLLFSICVAFTGSLLRRIESESLMVNFFGSSTSGKTTTQRAGTTVFGNWGKKPGEIETWSSTANGIEAAACLHNDGCLILDEIQLLDAKAAAKIPYLIGNGQGKKRADRDGNLRAVSSFVLSCLSSGEICLKDLAASNGDLMRAGAELRCIDIPTNSVYTYGLFNDVHGAAGETTAECGKNFADSFKLASSRQYGTAGPEFISRLAKFPLDQLNDYHKQTEKSFISDFVTSKDASQVLRVASRFAAVATAGELASHWGITGWPPRMAYAACGELFKIWFAARGISGNSEEDKIIQVVREFLGRYGDSRFEQNNDISFNIPNRAGFTPIGQTGKTWWFLKDVFKNEVCKDFNFQLACKALHDRGHLDCSPSEKPHSGTSREIKRLGGQSRIIAINSSILA